MDINKYLNEIKKGGNGFKSILVILLIGVALVITASFFKNDTLSGTKTSVPKSSSNNTISDSSYEESIKNELQNTLQSIQGVGRVQVMITFESGEEDVPAYNVTDSTNKTTEKDTSGGVRDSTQENNGSSVVTTNNSDGTTKPFIIKTNKPKAVGVLIVAQGAEDTLTQLRIEKVAMDLLDLSGSKVNVYPMKK